MKKINLIISLVCCCLLKTIAQQPIMAVPEFNFPVSTSGIGSVTTIAGASSSIYRVSNGAYDNAGNLLFYVKDNGIYDENSVYLSPLTSFYDPNNPQNGTESFSGGNHKEIAIVPVPHKCNMYFVLHHVIGSLSSAGALVYELVDCNGPTPVVSMSNANANVNPFIIDRFSAYFPGIAIRKANVNGNYYLYSLCNAGLLKYDITSTGFTNKTILLDATTSILPDPDGLQKGYHTSELDISPDGKWIAWGVLAAGPNINCGKVYKFELTDPNSFSDIGNLVNTTVTKINLSTNNLGQVYGLEFDLNNDLLISAKLPSGNNGLFKNIHGQTTVSYIPSTFNYLSQIERRLDNQMYFVNYLTGQYASLNMATNAITVIPTSTLLAHSNGHSYLAYIDFYSMPDQIDGEDYTKFNTKEDLMISDGLGDDGTEPSLSANIYESDIWNCANNNGCTINEDPKSLSTDYMNVIVKNVGCINSRTAKLHLYWTRGRSGEIWQDHWLDPSIIPSNTINGHPGGGEITVLSGTAISDPIIIPNLAPGASITLTKNWTVPDRNWFPLITSDNGVNPMICFLGRIVSTSDPMNNEVLGAYIFDNAYNNNNIVTRNSQILKGSHSVLDVKDGSLLINNPHSEVRNVNDISIAGLYQSTNVDDITSFNIILEPALYNRWVSNGRVGEGILDMGENVIQIQNFSHALISNLQILPGESFTILPNIIYSSTSEIIDYTRLYTFKIGHIFSDGLQLPGGLYYVDYSFDDAEEEEDPRSRAKSINMDEDHSKVIVSEDGVIQLMLEDHWKGLVDVNVFNISGEQVLSKRINLQNNLYPIIDVKDFASGMYLFNISNETSNKTLKLTITK